MSGDSEFRLPFLPQPKPNHKRRKPKKGNRGKFTKDTREKIIERFNGQCAECGAKGIHIHHIKFKSEGGRGVETNGVLVCNQCHRKIHDNRELAEKWMKWAEVQHGKDYYKDIWDKYEDIKEE